MNDQLDCIYELETSAWLEARSITKLIAWYVSFAVFIPRINFLLEIYNRY